MSRQWQPKKQTVELQPGARPSRIRREPPGKLAKSTVVPDRDERDRAVVVIGVITFALALCVLAVAFASYIGWSPSQYSVRVSVAQ
jgi:hypothetical protein